MGGDSASHPLTCENYYDDKIPDFFMDNEMGEYLGTSIASATRPLQLTPRQIVIKPQEAVIAVSQSCEPKAWQEAKQSLSRRYDAAVKIGATQIKLDTRLLGERWKVVLGDILSSNCV